MSPRVVDRDARRAELASAAARVFAERGVANTSVSDIVKAAGVAQGTFYLYFESKDDAVAAVVEQMAAQMVSALEAAANDTTVSAAQRMRDLAEVFSSFESEPGAAELVAIVHDPANRALHDRLAENLMPSLVPLVESIVEQGVAEGTFHVPDTHAAAWFVLGGLQSIELMETPAAEMPAAFDAAVDLALSALGCDEESS